MLVSRKEGRCHMFSKFFWNRKTGRLKRRMNDLILSFSEINRANLTDYYALKITSIWKVAETDLVYATRLADLTLEQISEHYQQMPRDFQTMDILNILSEMRRTMLDIAQHLDDGVSTKRKVV